jgi:predicted small secreted protein
VVRHNSDGVPVVEAGSDGRAGTDARSRQNQVTEILKMQQSVSSWLFILFFSTSMVVGLAGCNTIEGAGEDVEAAGEAVEDTAEDASN